MDRIIFTGLQTPLNDWQHRDVVSADRLAEASSRQSDLRRACRVVRLITQEVGHLAGTCNRGTRERRQKVSQSRQISMYVCHVALQFSLSEIGQAFRRDRTTVAYACRVIEDRRDDRSFDEFVASIERLSVSILASTEEHSDG